MSRHDLTEQLLLFAKEKLDERILRARIKRSKDLSGFLKIEDLGNLQVVEDLKRETSVGAGINFWCPECEKEKKGGPIQQVALGCPSCGRKLCVDHMIAHVHEYNITSQSADCEPVDSTHEDPPFMGDEDIRELTKLIGAEATAALLLARKYRITPKGRAYLDKHR